MSTSKNDAKNTDGWDIFRSDNVVIADSNINNGDDCVSFKPSMTQFACIYWHPNTEADRLTQMQRICSCRTFLATVLSAYACIIVTNAKLILVVVGYP